MSLHESEESHVLIAIQSLNARYLLKISSGKVRSLEFLVRVAALGQAGGLRNPWHVVVQLLVQEEEEEPQRVSPRKISLHHKMELERRLWVTLK